jgi:putative transposase
MSGAVLSGCPANSDRPKRPRRTCVPRSPATVLTEHGLVGSMGRSGNPYDNAKAESFMKTRKVEGVYPMAFETSADVAAELPRFIEEVYNARRLNSATCYLTPCSSRSNTLSTRSKPLPDRAHPQGPSPHRGRAQAVAQFWTWYLQFWQEVAA